MVSTGGVDSFRFRGFCCPSMMPALFSLFALSLRISSFIKLRYRALSASGLRRSALYVSLSRINWFALRDSAMFIKADESTPTERRDWKKSRISKGVCSVNVAIPHSSLIHTSRARRWPATDSRMGARLKDASTRKRAREETTSSQSVPATDLSTASARGIEWSIWVLRGDPNPDPAIASFVRHSARWASAWGPLESLGSLAEPHALAYSI